MAYRVVFSDRTQVSVDQEQGKKLIELQASVTKPNYVMIAGSSYKLSSISKIVLVPDEIKTLPMIDSGIAKRHDKSIHGKILQLYTKELQREKPRKWEEFRAKAYDYLYSQSEDWCDDRKGTCVCGLNEREDSKQEPISTEQVKQVMDFMRS